MSFVCLFVSSYFVCFVAVIARASVDFEYLFSDLFASGVDRGFSVSRLSVEIFVVAKPHFM